LRLFDSSPPKSSPCSQNDLFSAPCNGLCSSSPDRHVFGNSVVCNVSPAEFRSLRVLLNPKGARGFFSRHTFPSGSVPYHPPPIGPLRTPSVFRSFFQSNSEQTAPFSMELLHGHKNFFSLIIFIAAEVLFSSPDGPRLLPPPTLSRILAPRKAFDIRASIHRRFSYSPFSLPSYARSDIPLNALDSSGSTSHPVGGS